MQTLAWDTASDGVTDGVTARPRRRHKQLMTLLIQALPLLALVLLLAQGRAGPIVACLLAMLAAITRYRAAVADLL